MQNTNNKSDNRNALSKIRDDLCGIANNPRNEKFKNLVKNERIRCNHFKNDNWKKYPKFRTYKRGAIVFVDFGINVGSEFSLPHFAVVLNNKDHIRNSTLTVVPLTSKNKGGYVNIGLDLFNSIFKDIRENLSNLNESQNEHLKKIDFLKKILSNIDLKDNEYLGLICEDTSDIDILKKIIHQDNNDFNKGELVRFKQILTKIFELISKGIKEVDDMREDSKKLEIIIQNYGRFHKTTYANPKSITTISKFKIKKKINDLDPVGDIFLDDSVMDEIEKGIHKHIFSFKSVDNT